MPLFKNTVALEACPAKTAESISYGAIFAVLGGLLVSNYSGFGQVEPDDQSVASTPSPSTETSITAAPLLNRPAAYLNREALNELPVAAVTLDQQEAQTSNFVTPAPAWHAEIEQFQQFQQFESQPHQRAFTTAPWSSHAGEADQQIKGFINILDLDLPLPIAGSGYLADAKAATENDINGGLVGNALGATELIREITVTGEEAERQLNRPENIQRPQIPRPYRAQEIQRSLILPPRIQALKP